MQQLAVAVTMRMDLYSQAQAQHVVAALQLPEQQEPLPLA
jgi:hypothetical protein